MGKQTAQAKKVYYSVIILKMTQGANLHWANHGNLRNQTQKLVSKLKHKTGDLRERMDLLREEIFC